MDLLRSHFIMNAPSSVDHYQPSLLGGFAVAPNLNFQYCQPAQNQPKSHILFHINGSPRDLYSIMTLTIHAWQSVYLALLLKLRSTAKD